jgi:hypothetical protein
VYAAGAVLYFVLREVVRIDFILSPLLYGLLVLGASAFRPRLLATAIVLICWGIAVVLDGKGPLADGRTAQVHTIGFGAGALVLWLLRDRIDAAGSLQSLATVMLVVGAWYYFVYDYPVLERAWLWSAVFLATAIALVVGGILRPFHIGSGRG